MRVYLECVPCFVRQALQAAEFCGADPATRERVLRKTLRALDEIRWDGSPMGMARVVHGLVRRETGVDDPYRTVKERSNGQALNWYENLTDVERDAQPSMETAIRLAIAGNMVDYGANATVDLDAAVNELRAKPLALSNEDLLLNDLMGAQTMAYLADNAGEIVFDRLLLETINRTYGRKECLFVTRKEPFINDVLWGDADAVGLTRVPGIEMAALHPLAPVAMTDPEDCELWNRIRSCDVIISKGQGNYEGFSGEAGIYFLLVIKCPVVARDLKERTGKRMTIGDAVLWKS
jgi:uncharacterized protein with ATP-grasp and redox domains